MLLRLINFFYSLGVMLSYMCNHLSTLHIVPINLLTLVQIVVELIYLDK